MERVLAEHPGEADRLSARFEAIASYQLQHQKDLERQSRNGSSSAGSGWSVDEEVGGDDEEDFDPNAEGTD